jgi:hypothetical protein
MTASAIGEAFVNAVDDERYWPAHSPSSRGDARRDQKSWICADEAQRRPKYDLQNARRARRKAPGLPIAFNPSVTWDNERKRRNND